MRTVTRLSRWLCIPVLLPLWPAAGQKPGELYVSPLKNFSIAVPKFAFGTRVQKSNNRDGGLVVFIGGVGGLGGGCYWRLAGGGVGGQDPPRRRAAPRGRVWGDAPGQHPPGPGRRAPPA